MGNLFPAFKGSEEGQFFPCIGYFSFGSGGASQSAILKDHIAPKIEASLSNLSWAEIENLLPSLQISAPLLSIFNRCPTQLLPSWKIQASNRSDCSFSQPESHTHLKLQPFSLSLSLSFKSFIKLRDLIFRLKALEIIWKGFFKRRNNLFQLST